MADLTQSSSLIPLLLYGVLIAVMMLLSIWVLLKIARLLIDLLPSVSSDDFHPKMAVAIFSFAIAVWIYPRFIDVLYSWVSGIARTVVSDLPRQASTAADRIQFACGGGSGSNCLRVLADESANVFNSAGRSLIGPLADNPVAISVVAYFFAIWVAAAMTVRMVFIGGLTSSTQPSWREELVTKFRALNPNGRQNLGLVCVLLLSAYLSITSIVVVPILKGNASEKGDDSTKLRQQFERSVIETESEQEASFADLFQDLRGILSSKMQNASSNGDEITYFKLSVSRDLDGITKVLQEHQESYKDLITFYQRQRKQIIEDAIDVFDRSNDNRNGARERTDHLLALGEWYRDWFRRAQEHIVSCHGSILNLASEARNESLTVKGAIASGQRRDDSLGDIWRRTRQADDEAYRSCSRSGWSSDIQPPSRPMLGAHLGFIGWASGWLLQTESMPLALIVGMVGFGLLGAVSSAFVRDGVKKAPGEALVQNLPGVIILGSSAAMVIFLGVFGGLAMFANAAVDPNPYVILFTCFVAAVFSEDAWKWAQARFQSQLGERDKQNILDRDPIDTAKGDGSAQ